MSAQRPPKVPPEALLEVPVRLWVELGRTRMLAAEAAALDAGAVVDLEEAVEEPLEAFVEGRPFARGQLVLVDGEWALRIDEVLTGAPSPSGTGDASGVRASGVERLSNGGAEGAGATD